MTTRCERQGRYEVGVVEHDGRAFRALGASVVGRQVTAYTRRRGGKVTLTTWCGRTMLACRCEVVETYVEGEMALMFRLTGGGFIVGYALGDDGMLFRGELITGCDDDEARRSARQLAHYCAERDAEDEIEGEDGEG